MSIKTFLSRLGFLGAEQYEREKKTLHIIRSRGLYSATAFCGARWGRPSYEFVSIGIGKDQDGSSIWWYEDDWRGLEHDNGQYIVCDRCLSKLSIGRNRVASRNTPDLI